MQEGSTPFLFHHPAPNSLVFSASSKGRRQHLIPPGKEGKKLDAFGRCLYSASLLGIKSCNYIACMARFIYALFEDMALYLNNLPLDQRDHVLHLSADGLVTAKQEITYVKHTLESAVKTLIMAVALRRHSWLHKTNLPFNTRGLIEDLAFDGTGHFHSTMDTMVQDLDKSIKTSRTLGVSAAQCPPRSKSTYHRYWSRQSFSSRSRSLDRPWRQHTLLSSRPSYQPCQKFQQAAQSKASKDVRESKIFDCSMLVPCLSLYLQHWDIVMTDAWVLQFICDSYALDFSPPTTPTLPNSILSSPQGKSNIIAGQRCFRTDSPAVSGNGILLPLFYQTNKMGVCGP